MNKTNTLDILLIVVLIAAYASFIYFIKVCIDLKIYNSCYNKPATEFYNNHEKICKKYKTSGNMSR